MKTAISSAPDRLSQLLETAPKTLVMLLIGAPLAIPFLAAFAVSGLVPEPSTTPPAAGADILEVVIATAGASIVTAGLLLLGIGHRTGRFPLLAWGANIAERVSGLPGWAALPAGIAAISLVTAVVGMYWDISLHIDVGRDPGPLANPAHYFILIGLFGIFSAGFVAMVLPRGRPSASAVHIAGDWHAPLGGVLICACGAFSLIGFPLDDVWHRLFGQDVTLWGPTHLMLLGGAAMTLLGLAILLVEGARASEGKKGAPGLEWVMQARLIALSGAFLIALSIFQAEFDFGVPQFRFVFQPMLIAAAAGIALVAVRLWLGPGAALGAVAFYLGTRGALALLVGPVLGETTPHFPLYVVEALVVELVALRISRQRPLAFAAAAGVLIGTVGIAAEWGWSHLWMPIPWPGELLPEAAILGFAMAVCGALIGAWIGTRLAADELPSGGPLRIAAAIGAVAVTAMVGFALYTPAETGVSGQVSLSEVQGGPERSAIATVRLQPTDAADDAEWLTATAWQGGDLVVDRLDRVGPGTYRTPEPIPIHGSWKTVIRLHDGNSLIGLPVYLPEDEAIPAPAVPARPSFTREFVSDDEILQREAKSSGSGLKLAAYGVVLAITLVLLALLAWGLQRLAATAPGGGPTQRPAPSPDAGRPIGRPAAATG